MSVCCNRGVLLDRLAVPIVQAPMAGGPSTPELAAAVAQAGALGFVAAGYRTPDALAADVAATRALTPAPLGVNVFTPGGAAGDPAAAAPYARRLAADAQAAGAQLGAPRRDDDAFAAKMEMLIAEPVAAVSFTFGLPPETVVADLKTVGSEVWITVTGPDEARLAEAAGADVLVVQGVEAGGHRGLFRDEPGADGLGLLAALQLVRAVTDLPLVGGGAIMTGAGVAAVLAAGAAAAQLGTVFLRCPEAGTSAPHRAILADGARPTGLTRAFTGRLARGVRNRLMDEHPDAPVAYPDIHHVTAPLRAAARASGDPEVINLWAGQAYALAPERPAGEIVAELAAGARAALGQAAASLSRSSP